MSSVVSSVIYSTLAGSSAVTGLLASDPVDHGPAIYYGKKNLTPPVYPQINFKEVAKRPETKLPTITVDREIYQVMIYTQGDTGSAVDDIFAVVDPLFHRQRPDSSQLPHNYLYEILRITGAVPAEYDSKLKAWFGFYLYAFPVWTG